MNATFRGSPAPKNDFQQRATTWLAPKDGLKQKKNHNFFHMKSKMHLVWAIASILWSPKCISIVKSKMHLVWATSPIWFSSHNNICLFLSQYCSMQASRKHYCTKIRLLVWVTTLMSNGNLHNTVSLYKLLHSHGYLNFYLNFPSSASCC